MRKAGALLGGEDELARHLGATAEEVQRWIQDDAKPPLETFLRAVDLLIDETAAPDAQ